ncbi:hypothetical protein MY4824_009873 [Beauveria thailandica]
MFLAFKTTPSASAGAQPSTAPRKHMDAAQDILTILAEETVADGDAGDALAST